MHFYLTIGFLGFKVVKKWTMNIFKGKEDFEFSKSSLQKSLQKSSYTQHKKLSSLTSEVTYIHSWRNYY